MIADKKEFERQAEVDMIDWKHWRERAEKAEAKIKELEDAFLQEQQACVDALSRLDDTEDKVKDLESLFDVYENKQMLVANWRHAIKHNIYNTKENK